MNNSQLREHAERLSIKAMVDCPRWCRHIPREKCTDCAFCASNSPLSEYVECAFGWAWKNDPLGISEKLHKDAK
uniref:Uncharacterized protein n=1 Tax=viral metagenome TaxID=1070528 RepID=A0A6M3JGF1_9ZZZZ